MIFEDQNVEFPKDWSQTASNVVTSKYFSGALGTPSREKSLKQVVERVSRTLTDWGKQSSYFNKFSAKVFEYELSYILVHQKAAFNSPVWFNCGVLENMNQFSACFINSVEDQMKSIMDLAKTEAMLFKWGSGTGTNLSVLRSSREGLSGGGIASGPVSFMKGYDAFAGVIKSGGKTRRAAKMVILNVDHPDIQEFIDSKANEEKKAWALIEQGYDGSFTGEAYGSIAFQNANHSVRVSDAFMQAVLEDKPWTTKSVLTNTVQEECSSRQLLLNMAKACHVCGDPGIQFDTIINHWHTCPNSGRIEASNPCSEYMFLNDTACNLSSINLMQFRKDNGCFDLKAFCHTVEIMILAQEIMVGYADYPTPKITKNSHDFRPLGLGYANLGALLMSFGLSYDSQEARTYAGLITAIMTGQAYKISALMAKIHGPFKAYPLNKEPMLRVMRQHKNALKDIPPGVAKVPKELYDYAEKVWDQVLDLGEKWGYRNAQATVLAPTGTIAFMMDCDTTGIEPDIALVKYKKLVGGGLLKIVNQTVPLALSQLGYTEKQVTRITDYIDQQGTIEGCPDLQETHLSIFDCAFKAQNGTRSISYMGHIKMMAACQPFLSGAISKTVNMPEHSTDQDIYQTFIESWKRGLKAVAIYRDGSKRSQPLRTSLSEKKKETVSAVSRKRLPPERTSLTHKFSIGGHEGYITVGMYEDKRPGEIFITMAKEGSVVSGLMDSFATAISLALQYGVPLKILIDKFMYTRFEPSGWTSNSDIPLAKSILDYIFKWLSLKFPESTDPDDQEDGLSKEDSAKEVVMKKGLKYQIDTIPCWTCGSIMVPSGSCYRCLNCGNTSGCS